MNAVEKAEAIQRLQRNTDFGLLEEAILKLVGEVHKDIESIKTTNRDYLAGYAKGLQQYKALITALIKDGEIAKANLK